MTHRLQKQNDKRCALKSASLEETRERLRQRLSSLADYSVESNRFHSLEYEMAGAHILSSQESLLWQMTDALHALESEMIDLKLMLSQTMRILGLSEKDFLAFITHGMDVNTYRREG